MIKLDDKNYRIHGDKNKRLIKKSLEDCGAGRSILVDKDNVIIAGNGVFEQAKELGLAVRIIESTGTELIVVKRTDLSTDDDKRKLLALADNHTSDTSEFDFEAIMQDFTIDDLNLWQLEIDNFDCNIIDDLETGSFMGAVKEASDVFSITFSFEKEHKERIEEYIKKNGKELLINLIIEKVCQDVEVR